VMAATVPGCGRRARVVTCSMPLMKEHPTHRGVRVNA
jgi:hypothetical protein